MKKLILLLLVSTALITFQSTTKKVNFSSNPPSGYTGATGDYCTSCHGGNSLNSSGGSVTTSGLPTGSYVAGQQYNFSLTISHGAANRTRWGFAVRAVNGAGQDVGTFSSTNSNASVSSGELTHNNAVSTTARASYTYNNVRWTAPASPGTNDNNVTFYYVGNAANGSGSNGDFIYSNSSSIALPAVLANLKAQVVNQSVKVDWQATQEINVARYEIEKSNDAQFYYSVGKVNINENKSYSFTDNNPSYFNKPIYYRIKIVDNDGSVKYSNVLTVTIKATKTFISKVYPTLVTKGTTVIAELYSEKATNITIQLIDINGRVLQQTNHQLMIGNNKLNFQIQKTGSVNRLFAKFIAKDFAQTIPLLAN
ncbi:MAG: hypothetical protein MUE72_02345 [Chitinophagaceae bacterium]|nr:hypothetical protein [Chitinophagaceae bacterium]